MRIPLEILWWVAPLGAAAALAFARVLHLRVMRVERGNERMIEIADCVQAGAMAYLGRQNRAVAVVFAGLAAVFAVLAKMNLLDPFLPVAFLAGGVVSGLAGFLGMRTAVGASSRTANSAMKGLNNGLQVAFRSGAVTGLVAAGLGLLFVCAWYFLLDKVVYSARHMASGFSILGMAVVPPNCAELDKLVRITTTMITFGMGASTQALFARVGGGIFNKAADIGADLAGKLEAAIPQDDPRNPAVIADNVGDNVGGVAGMGADLLESYLASILATSALGASVGAAAGDASLALAYMSAPMIVAGIGNMLSILGIYLVRCREGADQRSLLHALLSGIFLSAVLTLAAVAGLAWIGLFQWGIFGSVLSGLLAGALIGHSAEYYTSGEYPPARGIAGHAQTGAASAVIDGLATGMFSTCAPAVVVSVAVIASFGFAGGLSNAAMGLYGIGFAAVGMVSTLGITLATGAYGAIADNAGGNAAMAGLPEEVRARTGALDSLGDTLASACRGLAAGSAAMTAIALLVAFIEVVKNWIARLATASPDGMFRVGHTAFGAASATMANVMDYVDAYELHVMNPLLLGGMFIGAMTAFLFSAMTLRAVGRAAGAVVGEVRRQFREIAGIMEGTGKPDYARCVAISAAGAQKTMVVPSLLAIAIPVATGMILGVPGVVGLLAGSLTCGFVLATVLNNAGGAWDNARKYIERGNLGGKKLPDGRQNPAHAAAVVGDAVGDPCKDTSGPSLNIFVKLMSMVCIVFAPVIVRYSPAVQDWLRIAPK